MRGSVTREDIPADISELIRIGAVVEVDLAGARCRVRYGDAALGVKTCHSASAHQLLTSQGS